jgi:hypothetical protein
MSDKMYHPIDLMTHGSLRVLVDEAKAAMVDSGLTTLEALAVVMDSVHEEGIDKCAEEYLDTLEMEGIRLTAETVVSLSDVDGMSMELLFYNHVDSMRFLEELSEEV